MEGRHAACPPGDLADPFPIDLYSVDDKAAFRTI
jgi:hypothetical protein